MFGIGYSTMARMAVMALAIGATAGCERSVGAPTYQAVGGVVEACQLETGEMTVRLTGREARSSEEKLHCVITKDSEIYVNDRFTKLQDIEVGDRVELIGYRDPSPQQERFVVTYAYGLHAMERPAMPAVLSAAIADN